MSKHIDANKPEMDFAANWTPMSERFPDEGGSYLVCWDGKTVDTGFFFNGHFLGVEVWREKDCAFSVRLSERNSTGVSTGCRVVGNIHDDPDMLERRA